MLPPIDDVVLQSNPRFATLHATLKNNILNPNGSTKSHPAQKERDAVTEAFTTAQIREAKSQLIKTSLNTLDITPPSSANTSKSKSAAPPKPPLPTELVELILLLSARLTSTPLTPKQIAILENTPQWTSLPTHLPRIATLISTHLQTQALSLARIQSPTTNASFLHRQIPQILPSILSLQSSLETQRTSIAKRRLELVSNTTTLLSLHHLSHNLLILHLEQTKHGLLSRHLQARSSYLSLLAQQVALQVREKAVKGERVVYSEEVRGALEVYVRHLRDARERLREKRGDAERVLWGYGVGRGEEGKEKERVMRSVTDKYAELSRELKDVGRDVERLRGR
ncbi:uncharacterized protein LY89DRAFT_737178 [Mollisia scopiformis]|uniref:HAUS augmin-like complex subunit 4 n=1 Tax=Mollisia scopiformis TaxID=149040 RepID=A0A194WZ10_MOLSC|nr:uncharacterized protein LY89DRAFT_737178 [Mollisia scopiformis]KUJ13198.1 hypothetical protein LY89DRAFT_737178 [Mollisia scopiformis]